MAVLQQEVGELGPWFHNLHLPDGRQTAPLHPLGDFPRNKWERISEVVPEDLEGWTALDVGCNAGFYTFELAKRGARVVAIDVDPHYLRQARWAAEEFGLAHQITFRQMQVYELAHEDVQYDLIWFMGVFYHLRYPLLALDIMSRLARRWMMFQTLTMPGEEVCQTPRDITLEERQWMLDPGWPKMSFIEHSLADDPTNWWAPNHACVEAMLRSSGFRVVQRPAHEVYWCELDEGEDRFADLKEQEYLAATQRYSQRG